MTQETLREAVAVIVEQSLLRHGVPLFRQEGTLDDADAAIATMLERLRDLPPSIYDGPDQYVRKADVLAAFQQENSEATTYKEIRALLEAAKCKACCGLGLSEMEFERNE